MSQIPLVSGYLLVYALLDSIIDSQLRPIIMYARYRLLMAQACRRTAEGLEAGGELLLSCQWGCSRQVPVIYIQSVRSFPGAGSFSNWRWGAIMSIETI